MNEHDRRVVGILPAAGRGTRLLAHGGEKELLPVGHREVTGPGGTMRTPRRVVEYVCDSMLRAGVDAVVVVTSPAKLDRLAEHLTRVYKGLLPIAFVVLEDSPSMPHSLAAAHTWLEGSDVVLGMPDTIPHPGDSFGQLLDRHRNAAADLTLGTFFTDQPHRFGMVDTNADGDVVAHADKPKNWQGGDHTWGIAAWGPRFTDLIVQATEWGRPNGREMALGDVFDEAMRRRFAVKALPIRDGRYYDIGDYDAYVQANSELSAPDPEPGPANVAV